MTIEVHSFGREVSARRTMAAALVLLIVCCGLAWGMSWKRSGDPLVAVRTPADWQVRFRVPRFLETVETRRGRRASALHFFGNTAEGVEVNCVLWKMPVDAPDKLVHTATAILEEYGGGNWFGEVKIRPPREGPMGKHIGTEIMNMAESTAVRIVQVDDDAYLVLFAVEKSTIDSSLYRLFDLTCRSMTAREN